MPLSQKGANYLRQTQVHRKDNDVGVAMDDLASQSQAIRTQLQLGQAGPPLPPHAVTAISVSATNGFASVSLTHANAPAGSRYVIEYSSSPSFQNPIRVDNGISLSWQQYLKGQTLYFRAAPTFLASSLGEWTVFGGSSNPTAVTF